MIRVLLLFCLLLSSTLKADAPSHWFHAIKVSDRHEFYQNNETLLKPKDAWQTLFSVVYLDGNLKMMKDCVFYRIPGHQTGVLKLKTFPVSEECDKHIFETSDQEWTNIKELQFFVSDSSVRLDITKEKYRSEKWNVDFFNSFSAPAPKMHLSSADYKAPKIIWVSKSVSSGPSPVIPLLKEKDLCHPVNEDCSEIKASQCNQCPMGWYEIPNGCPESPKYCGVLNCGKKNQPACRRGIKFQRVRANIDCRIDSSYAYCMKGLTVQCDGNLAFCR